MSQISPELKYKIWLIYLRKSRQDDPSETVEEVVAKHEGILQDWARRELGREIPEDCIYREIVSGGESLYEREEIQKVLRRIEDPMVAGVLVVDPQRLTRGSLEDCGRIISAFRFTHTLIITERDIFDLEQQRDRKYFESELMRGRDYLDYTKEILARGRISSIKKGCYIASKPPYGYDKVTIGKEKSLAPNDDADNVKLIFDLYVHERMTYGQIAKKLEQMGVPPRFVEKWSKQTVRAILRNYHYIGKVYYSRRKDVTVVENGERITRRLYQPLENVIMAEGKHPAIIDRDLFEQAQAIMDNNPRLKVTEELKNPFAGILKCGKCGKTLVHHPYHHALDRIECRTKPMCFKSAKVIDIENAVATILEMSELPKLKAHAKNGDGSSIAIQKKQIQKLENQMEEYRQQEETQYELLETKKYTQELFDKRNAALRQKMEDCEKKIASAKQSLPKSVDYEKKTLALENAIAGLRNNSLTPAEKNSLLKAVIEKIVMTAEEGKNRGETNIHLEIVLKL